MTDFDRIRLEVAENERWLAEVCERSSAIDSARIKQSVALAAQEAWLARQDTVEIPRAASSRIKAGVRAELARSSRRPRRWSRWVLGTSSVAAMVTLGVISFQGDGEVRPDDSAGAGWVAAFGALDDLDADFDAELSALQEAVGSLDGFGTTDEPEDDWTGDWGSGSEESGSGT